MFEVLGTERSSVVFRAGDLLSQEGPRERDGLLEVSARIINQDQDGGVGNAEVELSLKSCFVGKMSMVESMLHLWYARALLETGSWKVLR